MREIDLSLDLRLARARSAVSSGSRASALSGKVFADSLGFIDFNRARVRLLFRYSNQDKNVKNGLALDFQFPGQIVDSNFAHPPCVFSKIRLDHHNLT
jgi:hypothetical protein